jgi:hypothetical protein
MDTNSTKAELVSQIAGLIRLSEVPRMSTGSTEPKEILTAIDYAFGLSLPCDEMTKPDLAATIVRSAGFLWSLNCESTGGTITREGLLMVLKATEFFAGVSPES